MCPFDAESDKDSAHQGAMHDHVRITATQRLAHALALKQAISPSRTAEELQRSLGEAIKQVADEDRLLIDEINSPSVLFDKLAAAQDGQEVEVTLDQALQAGAFVEDALDEQAASDGTTEVGQDQDLQGVVS